MSLVFFISQTWHVGGFGLKEGEISVISVQQFFRAPLFSDAHFSCCQNWRSTSYTYIKIRAVFPLMKRGGFAGNKGGFFFIINGKREFVSGSYLAYDHLDRLTEGEMLVFLFKTKIAFSLHRMCCSCLDTWFWKANRVSLPLDLDIRNSFVIFFKKKNCT